MKQHYTFRVHVKYIKIISNIGYKIKCMTLCSCVQFDPSHLKHNILHFMHICNKAMNPGVCPAPHIHAHRPIGAHGAGTRAHTGLRLYLLPSQACTLYTIFIFKCTVGEGSSLVHSRCCGNKYFILESNCILWP